MKRLVMAAALVLAGTGHAAEAPAMAEVRLQGPKGEVAVVRAEVADTDAARERGLMNRKNLPTDTGMLFVWPREEKVSFWMRNTLIPLDMLFIRNGYVVAVAPNAKPLDETPIAPPMPVDAVLEVNGGWSALHKLGVGWSVTATSNPVTR
jgi:uncharacterized membrane protein (UPF0127 family)